MSNPATPEPPAPEQQGPTETDPSRAGPNRTGPNRTGPNRTALGRKFVLVGVLGALVAAGLVLYGDLEELSKHLRDCRWEWFGVAIALATFNYAVRFLRWQYYLRVIECPVPAMESGLVFLSGFAMSVTPGKVGEVFKSALLLESRGYAIERTAPVVVAERVTDLLALVLITALGALSFEGGIAVTLAGAVVVGLGILVCTFQPAAELVLRIAAKVPVAKKLTPQIRSAFKTLRTMMKPIPLLLTTLLSFAAWAAEVGSLMAVLYSLGLWLDWEAACFAYGAATIAGALAMLPGGLGVTEAGMTGLIQTLGKGAIGASGATTATLLTRLSTLWWAVLLGVMALLVYRLTYGRKPAQAGVPS